jgi:predicted acylesterase/phospholipase RssA
MTIAATYPDLYVHVQLPGIRMYHFDKYEEIIKAGENEMRDALLKEGRF